MRAKGGARVAPQRHTEGHREPPDELMSTLDEVSEKISIKRFTLILPAEPVYLDLYFCDGGVVAVGAAGVQAANDAGYYNCSTDPCFE